MQARGAKRLLLMGQLYTEGMRRILPVAARAGYEVDHALSCELRACGAGDDLTVWKLDEQLAPPDAVLHCDVRIDEPAFGLLEAWERRGVLVLNPPRIKYTGMNKWSQQDLFAAAGIPCPHTELVILRQHVHEFARRHGYPFVVKPSQGSAGKRVVPVEEYRHLRQRVEPFLDDRTGYVAQRMVSFRGAGGRSRDRKAVVVGNRIVSVMERTGAPGELAANRDGEEASVDLSSLTAAERTYAPAAARAVGAALCSVDYWLTDDHPAGLMVNEVNLFPALPPREAQPFAEAVVAYLTEHLDPTVANGVDELPLHRPHAGHNTSDHHKRR